METCSVPTVMYTRDYVCLDGKLFFFPKINLLTTDTGYYGQWTLFWVLSYKPSNII